MDCQTVRIWLFKEVDGELADSERGRLKQHLSGCPECARSLQLLLLPRRIGKALPVLEPSPYFYQRLRARIEVETRPVTLAQIILGLSRQALPAMAVLMLVLLSALAFDLFNGPQIDVVQAYDRVFMSNDRPQRMVIADQADITDEAVLRALAEEENARRPGPESATKAGK
jgi:predicted anti-sigma-YlaC factor YlaD